MSVADELKARGLIEHSSAAPEKILATSRTVYVGVDPNADWLAKVRLLPFLRDVGKYFTVNDLVKREVIKRRLDNPDESISYTEFSYSLLQGLDYLTLHERYG